MPFKCSVPFCRGNYDGGPKVSVFGFPEDKHCSKKWLEAIPRKNFTPSKSSRVCELHFRDTDIRRTTECYDERNSRNLIVSLLQPRLKEGAVPSIFPGNPKNLFPGNPNKSPCEDPSKQKEHLEIYHVEVESTITQEEDEEGVTFNSLDELMTCLENIEVPECYTVVNNSKRVLFLKLNTEGAPTVVLSVVVESSLQVQAYLGSLMLTNVNNHVLPLQCNNINFLGSLLIDVMQINAPTDPKYIYLLDV